LPVGDAGAAPVRPLYALRRRLHLRHAAAARFRAGALRAAQAQSRTVLARGAGRHGGQHAGRHAGLVAGLWRPPGRRQVGALAHARQGAGVAGAPGAQGLPAVVAADRGRSAVRGGRLAQAAVLALRLLHDDRQVPALRDDDAAAALRVPGRHPGPHTL
ncbi:MAG: probable membrane protein YPO3302, partial [uncultured Ramlibacter sp.]